MSVLDLLLEAFSVQPLPAETPQQSAAIGARQVARAQAAQRAGWNPAKHPRAAGGRFGRTTGGRRTATRSQWSRTRLLQAGARGPLVRSLQRQLHVSADGVYGVQTRAAVARYQRQHGLLVDGVVGRQTLAALRGHPNPQRIAPGPVASSAAAIKRHPVQRAARPGRPGVRVAAGAPQRMGGGTVI